MFHINNNFFVLAPEFIPDVLVLIILGISIMYL